MRSLLFCTCLLLLGSYVEAQDTSDPLVAQLDAALRSNDEAQLHTLEQKLLATTASTSTLLQAGILLAQNDKLTDAATIFERCSQQDPSSFEAKYNLALTRIGLQEYPTALEALNSTKPADADQKAAVEYLTGKVFLATNHLREAQKLLADAYVRRPGEENYALDLALLYIRSAAYVPAIDVLRASLTAHPRSRELSLELALADVLADRYADAIALSRKLQQQDPASSIPTVIVAFSYCSEKNYQACADESSAGLRTPQPHPYLYYLRARALWDSGAIDHSKILEDLSTAIRQMPKCSVCLLLRSRIYEAAHDASSAIADLKRVVDLDAETGSAWYRLSILYRKAGLLAQASDALEHYRSIHNDETKQEIESFRTHFMDGVHSKIN